MAVKAVNDTAGPDGIVPTLLVFGAYPRLTTWDAPASSITARAIAVKRAMEEVRRCQAARKVADALRMRNGPRTAHIADLPLDSEVLVWREGLGWKGPYKLLAMDGETCQLQLPRGPVNFRSTAIKPYYRPDDTKTDAPNPQIMDPIDKENLPDDTPRRSPRNANIHEGDRPIQEGQRSITGGQTTFVRVTPPFLKVLETLELQLRFLHMFLTHHQRIFHRRYSKHGHCRGLLGREGSQRQTDFDRTPCEGRHHNSWGPFAFSRRKEIDGLLARGVFELISGDSREIGDARIFSSRLVDEVKGKGTATPYEKSRLVIQ